MDAVARLGYWSLQYVSSSE